MTATGRTANSRTASSPTLIRPLARVGSIKTKWSIVIVAAVAVTAGVSQIGLQLGWPSWLRPVVAATLALAMVQFLAKGMTRPLRQMAVAAAAMAEGRKVDPIVTTSRDEVGRLAVAFNSMAAEVGKVDRLQREFIANASHELRTPVAALHSTLENLVDGVGQPDADTLGVMLAHAEHLGDLVRQLLDLSRLDALDTMERPEPIYIGDLLQEVTSRARLMSPGSVIEVKSAVDLPVLGDATRLHQLFTNLIANALRFSPPGAPVVVTACSPVAPAVGAPRTVRVSINDAGPGIPEDRKTKVFERFWQDDRPHADGGSGLGLAIAKRIVDTHGGYIAINDRHPTGTSVIVELPRQ